MSILAEIPFGWTDSKGSKQPSTVYLQPDGSVTWRGKASIDGDGAGPSHGDPDFQADTTLHWNGDPLNSDTDRYIVAPPAVIHGVKGVVLGCQAIVTYHGNQCTAVVGDVGPRDKIGEISIACARALNIPSSPNTGGVDSGVNYIIFPDTAAQVDGKTYTLQPSK